MAILNSSGVAVVEYTYDAWGKPLTTTGSMASGLRQINPLRYCGYVYDEETGLYCLQSRYYNPIWGRFISADNQLTTEHLTGINLFAYCDNNPVMYIDPYGTAPEWWQWVISGLCVVVGVALTAIGAGGPLGGALICSGVNSILGSYLNEAQGGSSIAGWVGGGLTGFFAGIGASAGGLMIMDAAKNTGVATFGMIAQGLSGAFLAGYSGHFLGSVMTAYIDDTI